MSDLIDWRSIVDNLFGGNDPSNYIIQSRKFLPEEELWLEVLLGAKNDILQCLTEPDGCSSQLFIEVFDWFFNEHGLDYLGSLESICLNLNLSVTRVRKHIIKLIKTNYKKENGIRPVLNNQVIFVNRKEIE